MGERTRRPTAARLAGDAYDQVTNNGNGMIADMAGVTPEAAAPWLGAISVAQGGEQLGQGMGRVAEGDPTGWIDIVGGAGGGIAGGLGAASGLGAALSWFGSGLTEAYLAGEATMSGVGLMNAGSAISSATAGGTGALGLGTSVGAAGALPVLGAVGAGAAGGVAIAQRGQSYIADTHLLGTNGDGTGRDWSDWAADEAWSDREAWADLTGNATVADIAGYASLTGRTVAGAAGAAVTGVAGLATDAVGLVGDAGSWAWSVLTDW